MEVGWVAVKASKMVEVKVATKAFPTDSLWAAELVDQKDYG